MGYYTELTMEIQGGTKVDIKKLAEIVKKCSDPRTPGVYAFRYVKFDLDNDILKNIILDEYYGKFYDDSMFAEDLSQAIISGGVDLYFGGEDGEWWGYRISHGRVDTLLKLIVTERNYDKCWEYSKKLDKEGGE